MLEIVKGRDDFEFVRLNDSSLDESLEYIKYRPTGITILQIDFLICQDELIKELLEHQYLESVTAIHFISNGNLIGCFENLVRLQYLTFAFPDSTFDFSKIVGLEFLGGVWSKSWTGLEYCKRLKVFHVSGYKMKVSDIKNLERVKKITFIQPNFKDIEGVQYAIRLESLEIIKARNLTDISALKSFSGSMTKLVFDECKKIQDFHFLENLIDLKWLSLTHCGTINSLSFMKNLTSVEFVTVNGTKIADGDYCFLENNKILKKSYR